MVAKSKKPTMGIREIAHALGCSERTVRRRHIDDDDLRTFQSGGPTSPIRIRRADLDKYIKRKGKR